MYVRDHVEMLDLRVGEDLIYGQDGPTGHASGVERFDPTCSRASTEPLGDQAVESNAIRRSLGCGVETRISRQIGQTNHLAKTVQNPAKRAGHVYVTVG